MFLYELLNFTAVIIYTICSHGEHIRLCPMMILPTHLTFNIIADMVNQVYLQKRLSANKVEHNRVLFAQFLMVQRENIVYSTFGSSPRHSLLRVLTNQIAILACKLTVFGNNECNFLAAPVFPRSWSALHPTIYIMYGKLSMAIIFAGTDTSTPATLAASHS